MDMLLIIAIVMFGAGILGGLINLFITDTKNDSRLEWWQHLIIGVGAAFMVPLFLNMISSGLIDAIRGTKENPGDLSKLFVLAGFCLVAAVSSRTFIRSLSEKVLQEVRSAKGEAEEAKKQAEEAKAAVAPFVEEEMPEESPEEIAAREQAPPVQLSEDERSVLCAMATSSLAMRSLSGLARDANLDKGKANAAISSLMSKNLIIQGLSSKGNPRWYLSSAGRMISSGS